MAKNYLVFDFGASNGRAIIIKYDGSKFEMEVTHRFENKPVLANGTLYWDILRLFFELKTGIQKSLKKYRKIESLAIDTWGVDFGLIDKNGKLISNPVHYRDAQRKKDSRRLFEIISKKELFFYTGADISTIFDLFHLFSLKINNSPEFLNGETFLTIPDIFNYFLTGKKYNELTRITTSVMYNQVNKKLEERILEKLKLPKKIFPKIIEPGKKIGKIKYDVSQELDTKLIDIIAPATHDTASAVIGIPLETNKNCAFLNLGTWCVFGQELKEPIINDKVFQSKFLNEGGAEDRNYLVKNISGLWIIQQCRENWVKDLGRDISWNKIVELSENKVPFRSIIDVDDPNFAQQSADMPGIIRKNCKNKNQKIPEDIGEVARCIYESLALKFKNVTLLLQDIIEKKIEIIYLIGGGIKNKLLCKWIADSTGVPVVTSATETTSIGNFLMQLKAFGEIKNLEEGRQISKRSTEAIYYEPENTDKWDEAYTKFLGVIK